VYLLYKCASSTDTTQCKVQENVKQRITMAGGISLRILGVLNPPERSRIPENTQSGCARVHPGIHSCLC
jgi:hypothetical protein